MSASRDRGSVLIVVLFVSVVLSLLAVSLAYRAGLVLRAARQRAIMVKLQAQMDSAAAIAMTRLAENNNDFDHPAEGWHAHKPLAQEGWLEEWGDTDDAAAGQFAADYSVSDEEGKLHVLLASSESLQKLGMNDEQIACLFDYMDGDDYSRPGGAENSYYQSLPAPRRCKNAPLETLDELLAVKGFGPGDYWGRRGGESEPTLGWCELLTTCGAGKVNINTAPRSVLRTLGVSEGAVDQIDAFRTCDAFSSGRLEDHAFRSYEDIDHLQGLTDADRQMLAGRATFASQHFRIRIAVRHVPTGLKRTRDMLVRSVGGKVDVLQVRRAS